MFTLSGANKGKQLENELKDEILIAITNEEANITFRITTIIASIASIVLNLVRHETESTIAATFVDISTVKYLVAYFILRVRSDI